MNKEECIEIVQEYYEEYGRSPTHDSDVIPYTLAKKLFGTWTELIKQSGVLHTNQKYSNLTVDEFLKLFESRCDKIEEGCWEANFIYKKKGYARITYNNITWAAHRLIYTLVKGPIPEGKLVRHTCDVKACCNPDHLEIGTDQLNQLDSLERGTWRTGKTTREIRPKNLPDAELLEWLVYKDCDPDDNGCFIWQKSLDPDGYGLTHYKGVTKRAARLIYILHNNYPNIEGQIVRHTCDVKACCNPDHLIIGTLSNNALDARKNRKGLKFNEQSVRVVLTGYYEVKENKNMLIKDFIKIITKEYNCSAGTVHDIIYNRKWKDVYADFHKNLK